MKPKQKFFSAIFHGLAILVCFYFSSLPAFAFKNNDTLHIYENLHVPLDDTLHLHAGKVVMFHGYYHISVEGTIMAEGSEEQPILFTTKDTLGLYNTYTQEGGWNGIRFFHTDNKGAGKNTSILKHCIFEYSKASALDFKNGGAISIEGDKNVLIKNSLFQHNYAYVNGGAVYANGASPVIKNSEFRKNTAFSRYPEIISYGGAIYILASNAEISWSYFEKNYAGNTGDASAFGGAIAVVASDPDIFNNVIYDNAAPVGGGMSILSSTGINPISNNLIINNESTLAGGGIAFLNASPVIANNTILNNTAWSHGGALFFYNESSPKFYNCIIRENSAFIGNQVFIWDISVAHFYNCNIEGGYEAFEGGVGYGIVYEDNIDEDPMFLNDGEHPYALKPDSPCIDTGYDDSDELGIYYFDLAGNERFSGIRIDMGAYEYQHSINYYEVAMNKEGKGSTEPPEGKHVVEEGTLINFVATPHDDWTFKHWETTAGIFTENPKAIKIYQDINVTAIFTPAYNVNSIQHTCAVLYPNPVSSVLKIRMNDFTPGELFTISLINSNGVIIDNTNLTSDSPGLSVPFDFEKIPPGIYFIKIQNTGYERVFKVINH